VLVVQGKSLGLGPYANVSVTTLDINQNSHVELEDVTLLFDALVGRAVVLSTSVLLPGASSQCDFVISATEQTTLTSGIVEVYAILSHGTNNLASEISLSELTASSSANMTAVSGSMKNAYIISLTKSGQTHSVQTNNSKFTTGDVGVTLVQVATVNGVKYVHSGAYYVPSTKSSNSTKLTVAGDVEMDVWTDSMPQTTAAFVESSYRCTYPLTKKRLTFSFDADFTAIYSNNQTAFRDEFKTFYEQREAAKGRAVTVSNITVIQGSIIVAFDVSHEQRVSDTLITELKADLVSGLQFTFNSQSLVAAKTLSIDGAAVSVFPAVAEESTSAGAIAGAIVAVLLLIVILVVIYLKFFKKKQQKKVDPADAEHGAPAKMAKVKRDVVEEIEIQEMEEQVQVPEVQVVTVKANPHVEEPAIPVNSSEMNLEYFNSMNVAYDHDKHLGKSLYNVRTDSSTDIAVFQEKHRARPTSAKPDVKVPEIFVNKNVDDQPPTPELYYSEQSSLQTVRASRQSEKQEEPPIVESIEEPAAPEEEHHGSAPGEVESFDEFGNKIAKMFSYKSNGMPKQHSIRDKFNFEEESSSDESGDDDLVIDLNAKTNLKNVDIKVQDASKPVPTYLSVVRLNLNGTLVSARRVMEADANLKGKKFHFLNKNGEPYTSKKEDIVCVKKAFPSFIRIKLEKKVSIAGKSRTSTGKQ